MQSRDGGTDRHERSLPHRLRPPVVALLALSLACGTSPRSGDTAIQIALHRAPGGTIPTSILVTGLTSAELTNLRSARLSPSHWETLLRVTVNSEESLPAVQGAYTISKEGIRFMPRFPFDPGRSYRVSFDPTRLTRPRRGPIITTTVALPAVATAPSTKVTAVHPSADVVPENLLRMYVEFSAPMGSSGAHDFVRLIDRSGTKEEVVEGAFLPIEADFWSPDHTRYTLFLDPGRVKRDILPNRQSGRPLHAGRRYVLEIDSAWTDANRQPLTATYRHEFTAGPVVDSAIRVEDWTIKPAAAGTRDPLAVAFRHPLDHAVVMRALHVESGDQRAVAGTAATGAHDKTWTFVPAEPWMAGPHHLVAMSFLEDPQGNQINRPFEEAVDRPTPERAQESFRVPFQIPANPTR